MPVPQDADQASMLLAPLIFYLFFEKIDRKVCYERNRCNPNWWWQVSKG